MNKMINYLISMLLLILSLIMFLWGSYMIYFNNMIFIEWQIICINSSSIMMSILLDWMSLVFMSFVLGISSIVMFYSIEYMNDDINKNRFNYLVFMFVLSMMFLIISPNLISILIGWDGLGLISYCLVIYYQNNKSYNAGMITSLTNRIGDVALLMSISWMMNFGSWNYIFYLNEMINMNFIIFMIVLASFTKSAQIPFSSWLPAAMSAPTPVSSLVHSSTLVTAGVYLMIRFNIIIMNSFLIELMMIFSLLTMIMSSIGANFEFDLKKIIALSTLSQLGFMMSTLMLGYPTMAFFHLLIHALFKALLFLCAGVMIHCMWGNQDIRFMGSLIIQLPIITSCMNISNLALCGFPFLSGFYSKDLIMESVMMSNMNFMFFCMFMMSVGLTVMYSIRLSYYSMLKSTNMFSYMSIFDCSNQMKKSIILMVFFSICGGSFLSWMIFCTPVNIFLPIQLKMLTMMLIMIGILIGYEISFFNKKLINNYNLLMLFFFSFLWFMPMFSTYFINNSSFKMIMNYSKLIDQGWGEYLGPMGLSSFIIKFSKLNQLIQINNFKVYMISFIIWFIFILMIM
uniref:NADH dehydrogenase subunit 5 n=1 Tax=Philagra albinotata TaxID=868271 RepID=UPI0025520086|nr:NADH dehydrogenase subunit 5 [Philagra albinotata]WGL39477.1 NADH dehydrogenase subunit 5 [Philagra albinotata]